MTATEQFFPVVLFITLSVQGVLTFESVDEILKCDHLQMNVNEKFFHKAVQVELAVTLH